VFCDAVMANKLINKADVISAKSERAKKCMLEMTDIRKNWTNSQLIPMKWGKLENKPLKKMVMAASISATIFNTKFRSQEWRRVLGIITENYSGTLNLCSKIKMSFATDEWKICWMSIVYKFKNRSISIYNLKHCFLRRMSWVN